MKIRILERVPACRACVTWLIFLMMPFQISLAQAQADVTAGEQVFQTYCFACHGIGEAQRVGPDLAAVHERRSAQWLIQFIKSPKTMFDNGDADAVALFGAFNGVVMPDSAISDQQIDEVLSYIQSRSSSIASAGSGDSSSSTAVVENIVEPASPEEISIGGDLFQGKLRFSNSGPACNACHDVRNDSVTGGGALAIELTSAYSKMGAAGLSAILARAPFPAMQSAYGDKPLSEQEMGSLVAFFQFADETSDSQQATNYGLTLFLSGGIGAAILFGLLPLVWRNRKVGSVNQSIYDRQPKL